MKRNFVIMLVVIFISLFFTACTNNQPASVTITTTTKITATEPGADGFRLAQEIIVKDGETVWGYSKEIYGKGIEWRKIWEQNPFLHNPKRTYYDNKRGEWIVIIKKDEHLVVDGRVISTSYVYEDTTTKTTYQPATGSASIEWWQWLVIIGGVALLVWLFGFYRNRNSSAFASSAVRVNLRGNQNIDHATELAVRTAMIERQQYLKEDIWYDSNDVILESARNNRLKSFTVNENENGIFVNANFRRDRRPDRPDRRDRNEPKQEEGK